MSARPGFREDRELSQLRVPPHSVEAEQAVLGALLLTGDHWHVVAGKLTAGDFYRLDHRLLWDAIAAQVEAGQPYDWLTVDARLEAQGQAERIGRGYTTELATTTPSAANILGYAEIVADRAGRRRLIEVGTGMVNDGFSADGRPLDELMADANHRLAEMLPTDAGGMVRLADALTEWWEQFSTRYEASAPLIGLPTPWEEYNRVTGGLIDQELTILAGRPSMGKSVLGFGMANHLAVERGEKVGVFSLETNRRSYLNRLVAARAQVPYAFVRAPNRDSDDDYTQRMALALRDIRRAPLFIDDTPSITARQFEARARAMHRREGLRMLLVDHIHEFKIDPTLARFEYGAVAGAGARLAKELGIPVVMLAQLNRSVGSRADKWPIMSDLRESGDLEQKADVVVFVHREDYYDRNTHLKGLVGLEFAKGRDIKAGERIFLRQRFDQMRADDLDGPIPEAPEPEGDRAPAGPRFGQNRRRRAQVPA